MELSKYKITDGSAYYGSYKSNDGVRSGDLYILDYWNGEHEGWSLSIIFDTKTQEVYEVQACDFGKELAYSSIRSGYNRDWQDDVAWDEVKFQSVSPEEYINVVNGIVNG